MSAAFVVREAVVADAAGMARVHIESSADAYAPLAATWTRPDLGQRTKDWQRWVAASGSTELVAVVGEEIVGFVGGGRARSDALRSEVEVYVVHVLPGMRSRGVGRRLWAGICPRIRGEALRSLGVETYRELRCCSFYEAHGGLLAETTPDTYEGGAVTRAIYLWPQGRSHEPRPYRLRRATTDDAELLFALKREGYREHVAELWGRWDDAEQRTRFFANFDPDRSLVVSVSGRDVGALSVDWTATPVFFASIELLPDARGGGLGTMIIDDVLARARVLGVDVRLQVLRPNAGAQRLYERLGFTPTGTSETHVQMLLRAGSDRDPGR